MSIPPAWAKSFLPPPPFPPKIVEAVFTRSTASYFEVKSLEIPTARPTLYSNVEIQTTIPDLISFFPWSIILLSSFGGKSFKICFRINILPIFSSLIIFLLLSFLIISILSLLSCLFKFFKF